MLKFQAKLALVTGASSGLGEAICHALANHKIPLILVSRNEEKLKKVASKLSTSTHVHPADLTNADQRKELIKLIQYFQPDLVINNAGFGLYGPTLAHPLSELEEMMELNVRALMEITIESARALYRDQKKGIIVNISSIASFFPSHRLTFIQQQKLLSTVSQRD